MKAIPHFEDLFSPEYYHEIQGRESRLAVLKLNEVRETLGDSNTSLIYSDSEEQKNITNPLELNVIRRFHIRHAIIDLNNSFDLLLQVPWFFYRAWESFNTGGIYHNSANNFQDILRNTTDWVYRVEGACNYNKLLKFLKRHPDNLLNQLGLGFEDFSNTFIYNNTKPFTIRTIANSIKHNGTLKITELRQPWNFNLKINGEEIDLKKKNLGLNFNTIFYDIESGEENPLGQIRAEYTDDLYIDIEYNGGEKFNGTDYVRGNAYYSINELYNEAVNYFDNIIDLFEKVYGVINPQLTDSPIMKKEGVKNSAHTINLDKYFKISDPV